MNVQPFQAIDSKGPFAIFPHNDEYAVAHAGFARAFDKEKFQTSWVIDTICPTIELAVEAMDRLMKEAKVRKAQELADFTARTRRYGG